MAIILVPAYGRKYSTQAQMLEDWEGGKDFKIFRGPYTSIRDLKSLIADFQDIYISYNPNLPNYIIEGKTLDVL